MEILVDSNVLIDVISNDPRWGKWSSNALEKYGETNVLVINPIIYSEVSMGFTLIEELENALPPEYFRRDPLPYAAGFLAGKCFLQYKKRGGHKRAPLPDFYIGAHAALMGMTLLTRDSKRYKTYFPKTTLLSPEEDGLQDDS